MIIMVIRVTTVSLVKLIGTYSNVFGNATTDQRMFLDARRVGRTQDLLWTPVGIVQPNVRS